MLTPKLSATAVTHARRRQPPARAQIVDILKCAFPGIAVLGIRAAFVFILGMQIWVLLIAALDPASPSRRGFFPRFR